MTAELIWTALPRGRDGSRLHLSVHVSPRLSSPTADPPNFAPLSDFPEVATWPPPDLRLQVVFPGFAPYETTPTSFPDPALWGKVFTLASPVRSYDPPQHAATPIHTFPLAKIAAFLRERYTEVALTSPEFFPAIDTLLAGGFEHISFRGVAGSDRWANGSSQLQNALSGSGVVDTTAASPPPASTFDFFQLRDFFAALDLDDPAVAAALAEPVSLPEPAFHWVVQALNQHPALLRLLGLVFDVDVDLGDGPQPSGATTVEILPLAAQLATAVPRTPRTRCVVDPAAFVAVPGPRGGHLADGFLRFDDPAQFATVLVDADGGGIKAVDHAGNLEARVLMATTGDSTDAALPTLRADGFSVARLGQAARVKGTHQAQQTQQAELAANMLELCAEDLVRGHRIDVWDSRSGAWHSLMRRDGSYTLAGDMILFEDDDEGVLGTAATRKPGQPDLYLSEEVFAWDGWSLVAPRPGGTLNTDVREGAAPLIDRPPNTAGSDYDVVIHADVKPGTLPALRYGVDYRFRARTVDLAGNSVGFDSPLDSHATPPLTFGRFEPPQTPPVLLRAPRGPGESAETVALRSPVFDQPAAPPVAYRHIVPPKVGEQTVERHGILDAAGQIASDLVTYDLLVARDAATLLNHPDAQPDPEDELNRRVYPPGQLPVTWAPDPAARRFAFRLLDGPHAGYSQTLPFLAPDDGADPDPDVWPFFKAWLLAVVEGGEPPSYGEASRVLTVPLAKGEVVHARLSCVVDPADLGQFGLWHWIDAALPPGQVGAAQRLHQETLVADGQHWLLEPYRILTLAHPVRRPLRRPELPDTLPLPLSVDKALGDTFVGVSGHAWCHRLSTERIDVLASWADPVDAGPDQADPDLPGASGSRVVTDQSAFVLRIRQNPAANAHPELEVFERIHHELGDTKHRVVSYRAIATTRFAEFFTSRATFPFDTPASPFTLPGAGQGVGVVPGSCKFTQIWPDGMEAVLVEGEHYTVDTPSGEVTFSDGSNGTAPAAGGEMHAVYLLPPVTRETADPPTKPGEVGPRQMVVQSSARPTAPKVLYVLPTFGWQSETFTQPHPGVTSTRRGNGLRVYLERPWWSSGAGELLGVVTWPPAELASQPQLDDEDPLRPYVTQWGDDPIYGARATVRDYPGVSAFPGALLPPGTGLSLDELGPLGPTVNVAGHAVAYDGGRGLWYCDIAVDPGAAYQPFVRLALARYQPVSVMHAHLSPVVLADFVQLAPDRFATVVFDQRSPKHVTVTVTGPAHQGTEVAVDDPGPARVVKQRRDASVVDDDLGWMSVGLPIELAGQVVDGVGTWTGIVQLLEQPGQGQNRLVIEQYELLGHEQEDTSANPFATPSAERLVYTDLIVL